MVERTLARRLKSSGKKLSVAESCTGGLLGGRISSVPGSSAYFAGGVIAYSDRVKRRLLGVSRTALKDFGAVSPQVAREMAQKVRRKFGTDYGIAVTGIAGPGSDGTQKPVGLVYIAVSSARRTFCKKFKLSGTRNQIRTRSSSEAIGLLLKKFLP